MRQEHLLGNSRTLAALWSAIEALYNDDIRPEAHHQIGQHDQSAAIRNNEELIRWIDLADLLDEAQCGVQHPDFTATC